jgi:hypothetical protein
VASARWRDSRPDEQRELVTMLGTVFGLAAFGGFVLVALVVLLVLWLV